MNYFIHMLLYFLRCEEYFSVKICTFYNIDCVQGLEFFHCNLYIIRLEKNHFGPKSIILCTNRKWGFLQCTWRFSSHCRALCKTELSRLYIKIGAQAVSSCQNSMRISCNMLVFKKNCLASYLASNFILGYLEAHNCHFMLWIWKLGNNFEGKIGIDCFLTWYDKGVGNESLTII